jgi:altronate hydrolase
MLQSENLTAGLITGAPGMTEPVVRLHPDDDVVIARHQLVAGMRIGGDLIVRGLIPAGHKLAVRAVAEGAPVRRYGQIIGFATRVIEAGEHVHTHNLSMGSFERDYAFGAEVKAAQACAGTAQFAGIVRADGRVATRNYIGILTSVNCSATAARAIADYFRRDIHPEALEAFPNVDGVVALTHGQGCAIDSGGEALALLRRTLGGYARHPNFAAVLVVGLGCETNQFEGLVQAESLTPGAALKTMTIQATGGTARTVAAGIETVKAMLAEANRVQREPVDARHLIIGLQCGGSDGYSGITANPALGAAVDRLVAHGGTAILSETPEVYGAEHLLTRRAVSRQIGEKLIERIHW